jgi:hypothetical protein
MLHLEACISGYQNAKHTHQHDVRTSPPDLG